MLLLLVLTITTILPVPVGKQAFFPNTLEAPNHKIYFFDNNTDNNLDNLNDDKRTKYEELRELIVSNSYCVGVHDLLYPQFLPFH